MWEDIGIEVECDICQSYEWVVGYKSCGLEADGMAVSGKVTKWQETTEDIEEGIPYSVVHRCSGKLVAADVMVTIWIDYGSTCTFGWRQQEWEPEFALKGKDIEMVGQAHGCVLAWEANECVGGKGRAQGRFYQFVSEWSGLEVIVIVLEAVMAVCGFQGSKWFHIFVGKKGRKIRTSFVWK